MKRNRWILVVAVLAVGLLGLWWWRSRAAGSAPKYRTAEADRGSIESVVSATGTVRPVIQVEIGSQVSGTVAGLHADYNDRVRAGQVLLELDKSSFKARAVQAEAAVARAQASVKDGDRAFKRAQELLDRAAISQAELDAASVAVELRKADLQQAQAELEAAQVDMAHATIRAPIDGVIISRSIDRGQTVAASLQAPKLFVIANDLSQMQVESKIDEADIGSLKPGLPVSFTVDAFPDRTFDGRVSQIRLEPITEQGVVTYTTVIQTANPDLRLRPGMTANVTVRVERRDDVTRIPNAALRFRPPTPPGGRGGGAEGARGAVAAGDRSGGRGEARAAMRGEGAAGRPGPAGADRGDGAARGPGAAGGDARVRRGGGSGADGADGSHGSMAGGARGDGSAGAQERGRGRRGAAMAAPDSADDGAKPATVYVLRAGKLEKVTVLAGITDGSFTEVRGGPLNPGDVLVVGTETSARGTNLQPPPGMGGPQFRGPGAGRR